MSNVFIGDSVTDCDRTLFPPYGHGWVNEIAKHGISAHYRTRIRIRLNTLDDFLTVLHLWEEKLPVWASQEELLALLIKDELIAGEELYFFGIVVKDKDGHNFYAPDLKIITK